MRPVGVAVPATLTGAAATLIHWDRRQIGEHGNRFLACLRVHHQSHASLEFVHPEPAHGSLPREQLADVVAILVPSSIPAQDRGCSLTAVP